MLIQEYDLRVISPPCEPGAERWSAFARLKVDISEALPYLNAQLQGCIYERRGQVLTWRFKGHAVSIRPTEIAIGNLADRAEAQSLMDDLAALCNEIWDRRAEIQPDYRERKRLDPMAIYRLLPGSNCKQCGEPTCFVFAAKLVVSAVDLKQCAPLLEDKWRDKRERLAALMESAV